MRKPQVFIPCLSLVIILMVIMAYQQRITFDPRVFMALLAVVLLRILAEKYNYEEVRTTNIKRGMVLSITSTALVNMCDLFQQPLTATEDVRSRLSDEEAERVRKWGESKKGKQELTIVRKMPFAIFISVGTILFMTLRVGII